tara:strand:- start:49 stop:384 length:336 start_codon:yes stop_codon:yes gene_type:complete
LYTFRKDVITISRNTYQYFSNKRVIKSPHFELQYVKSEKNCLGIIIPKKYLPLAVSRNGLRRKIRGNFRNHEFGENAFGVLLALRTKIQAEKKAINDILLPEWKSLLSQLH